MQIVVTCPQCSRQLRLPQETLGRAVRCPLCQCTFLTRESGGGAEAFPMAEPSAPKPPPPPPPPPVPKPAAPNLTLEDDNVSEAPLLPAEPQRLAVPQDEPLQPLRLLDEDDVVPEAKLLPPRPPRSRREEDDRPRRRREEEEEDEDDRPRRRRRDEDEERPQPPRSRRHTSFKPVAFAVRIHNDPNGRLEGRFSAAVDDEGLHLWRGRGRVIDVPTGQPVKQVEGARLIVPIEGRDVELTVIDPEGRSLVLADAMVAFFAGEEDRVELPKPKKSAGPVAWLMAVPIGIPLLAVLFGHSIGGVVGGILWGFLGLVIAGICALFLLGTSWSALARGVWAGSVLLVGYLILGCGFLFDGAGVPSSAWRVFRPDEGGFAVMMPGEPGGAAVWVSNDMRGGGVRLWQVSLPRAGMTFQAGLGEFKPESVRNWPQPIDRLNLARNALTNSAPGTNVFREYPPVGFALDPTTAVRDYELRLSNDRYGVARMIAKGRRVLILYVTSDSSITTYTSEVRRFLDSAQMDPFDEAPDPGPQPGDPPRPPFPPPDEPRKPQEEDLGTNDAKILGKGNYPWAGFSRDGRTIAAAGHQKIACFDANGQSRFTMDLPLENDEFRHAALSPDGRYLAVAGLRGTLKLVNLAAQRLEATLSPRSEQGIAQWCVTFSPDGSTVATTHGDEVVRLWNVARRDKPEEIKIGGGQVTAVAYSPDGKLLATSGFDHKIRVYDAATKKETASGRDPNGASYTLAFGADNVSLISSNHTATARLWDARTGEQVRTFQAKQAITTVAFHPPGRLLVTATDSGVVQMWEAGSGRSRGFIRQPMGNRPPPDRIDALAFNNDGRQLVVASGGRVELWQVERQVTIGPEDRKPPVVLPRNLTRMKVQINNSDQRLQGLVVCRNGSRFAAVPAFSTRLPIYAEATLKLQGDIDRGGVGQPVVALSPNGGLVAVATPDGKIGLSRSTTGALETSLQPSGAFSGQASALAFSDDGRQLVSGHRGTSGGELRLWDVSKGTEVRLIACRAEPKAVALSPDGLSIAVASSDDKRVRLYEAATGREYAGLVGHSADVRRIAYSPDGKYLASADSEGGVRLFDTKRCRQAFDLGGHERGVSGLSFSSDSATLAVGCLDETVKLHDVAAGKHLLTLKHDSTVVGVGFGPGGNSLVVASVESVSHWKLSEMSELKKRPAAVAVDLDKAPPPELPDLQPAGRIEPHLCHVVDAKNGLLLAFTRDKLCLHYSYPDLTLKGAWYTGAVIYRAALDADKGMVYAAVASGSLEAHDRGGWKGKGPIHVYDVKAALAGKAKGRRLEPAAVVAGDTQLLSLDVVSDGRWVVFVQTKPDQPQAKPSLGRIDTKTNKPAEAIELDNLVLAARVSLDRKTLYVGGQMPNNKGGFVRSIDLTTFKAASESEMNSLPIDMEVTEEYLVLISADSEILFLDRKKDAWPAVMRWRGGPGQPVARIRGGRAYVINRAPPRTYSAHDLEPKTDGRTPEPKARFQGPADDPLDAEFSILPDGKHLLNLSGHLLRISVGELALPQALKDQPKEKGKEEAPAGKLKSMGSWKDGHTLRVLGLAWSPKGQKVLTGGTERRLVIRLVESGKIERQVPAGLPVGSVAWARDDRHYAASTWEDFCLLVPTTNHIPRPLRTPGQKSGVSGLAFAADARSLAVAAEKDLTVWPMTFALPRTLVTKALTGVAVAPGTGLAAASGEDGQLRLFELTETKEKTALKGHDGESKCVAIGPDAKMAVTGGVDGKVKVWDVEGEKEKHSLDHGAVVLCVAIAGDGKLIASGGIDGSIKLWDGSTGKEVSDVPAHAATPIYALAFSPDGKTLAVASGSEVRRYDTSSLVGTPIKVEPPAGSEPVKPVKGDQPRLGAFRDAVIDSKGGYVLTVSGLGLLKRFSYPDFKPTGAYRLDRYAQRLLLDREKKVLYEVKAARNTVEAEGRLRAQEAELVRYDIGTLRPNADKISTKTKPLTTGERIKLEGTVGGVALSPDGKWFYYLDVKDNKLTKVDLAMHKAVKSADVEKGGTAMCLTPDGKTLWVASADGTDKGKLQHFDADLAEKGSHALDLAPGELVATDNGRVCVSGTKGTGKVVVLLDSTKSYRQLYRSVAKESIALALAGNQSEIYLSPRNKSTPFAIRPISATREAGVSGLPLVRVTETGVTGGELVASPDGAYLLLARTGAVVKLEKK